MTDVSRILTGMLKVERDEVNLPEFRPEKIIH
jgi:hypothetical protein